MSTSTLYLLKDNFCHYHRKDFQNATLFKPMIKLALEEQYKERLKGMSLETFFRMKDEDIVSEDRFIWWLADEKIFAIKDIKLVRDSIELFNTVRLSKSGLITDGKLLDKTMEFFNEIIQEFNSIIEEDYTVKHMKYFLFNADSRKNHVFEWFEEFDKDKEVPSGVGRMNKGTYVTRDITKLNFHVTDFIKLIKTEKSYDWKLIGNEEFDKDKYDYSD